MDERDKKKQELLNELARRFRDSAKNLKSVARRINTAAQEHDRAVDRMNSAGQRLRECVDGDSGTLPFTYLEYVEFTNAEEFRKFKNMPAITENEIEHVNWDDLCRQLVA